MEHTKTVYHKPIQWFARPHSASNEQNGSDSILKQVQVPLIVKSQYRGRRAKNINNIEQNSAGN